MLDLTETELDEVTSAELYALLLHFNETITLKRNVKYSYTTTSTPEPTIAEPEPTPVNLISYFSTKNSNLILSVAEIETATPSASHLDYGFTGERMAVFLQGLIIFTDGTGDVIDTDSAENLIELGKYDFLRAITIGDLSFALEIYHQAGVRYNWPEVTTDIATAIELIISDNEDAFDEYTTDIDNGESRSPLDSLLNDIKVSIFRLFDPSLVADEITD
jgi:hypothetical protein